MVVKIYIGKSLSNVLVSDAVPQIGDLLKIGKAKHRVVDVHWRMKITGVTEFSYAKVFLEP